MASAAEAVRAERSRSLSTRASMTRSVRRRCSSLVQGGVAVHDVLEGRALERPRRVECERHSVAGGEVLVGLLQLDAACESPVDRGDVLRHDSPR